MKSTAAKLSALIAVTDWGYGAGYAGAWPFRYGTYGVWSGAPRTYTDVSNHTEGTRANGRDAAIRRNSIVSLGPETTAPPFHNGQARSNNAITPTDFGRFRLRHGSSSIPSLS